MRAGTPRALQSRLSDGQLSMSPADAVRDASEQLLSRVRRLNRIAKLALVTIAVIVTGGTIALEGTTRWIVHTREVLRVIRTTQTRLVDREVHVLNARMSGRDVAVDMRGCGARQAPMSCAKHASLRMTSKHVARACGWTGHWVPCSVG